MAQPSDRMESLVSLCKRRGFIFQSSEIYGGINGFWDYGPLGVELKRNVKNAWWQDMVTSRTDMVGLDCAIIMHPKVWEASGHIKNFNDPMVDCKTCKGRFRADHIKELRCIRKPSLTVHQCACEKRGEGELTEARMFNMMFESYTGAVKDEDNKVYLRPETAQGIFANFKNVLDTSRMKVPFGIAQIGKAFRNEINPRNFTFRSREFEQMEIEFFCHPSQADEWYTYWRDLRYKWYIDLGLKSDKLRLREHEKEELAHYARACADVEYAFPFGTSELEGCANRTDFDLTQHQTFSGKDMNYFDDQTKEKFIPYVIEPSAGADRATLAFLCEAFQEDEIPNDKGEPEKRTVMRFHPRLAPIKAAILPLVKKEGMPEIAMKLFDELKRRFNVFYDEKGAIGRRYRRQDEAGTPYCFTIDGQTLANQTVTVRDRDSTRQDRLAIGGVRQYLEDKLGL